MTAEWTPPAEAVDVEAIRSRLREAEEEWLWHEEDDEVREGYGAHMSQMLYRLPADGQTRDMKASIEALVADLAALVAAYPAIVAEKDAEASDLSDRLSEARLGRHDARFERDLLAQAIHDARGILGFDNDGDDEPHVTDWLQYADLHRREAQEERDDRVEVERELDEALRKLAAVAALADAAAAEHGERIAQAIEEAADKYWDPLAPVVSQGTVRNAYEHATRIARAAALTEEDS